MGKTNRPVSLLSVICAPIFGIVFALLSLPAAVVSIWRMAKKGWK